MTSGMLHGMSHGRSWGTLLIVAVAGCGVAVDLGAYDGTVADATTADPTAGSTSTDIGVASSSSAGSSDTGTVAMQDDMAILVGDLPAGGGTSDTGANTSIGSGGDTGEVDPLDADDTLEIQAGNFPQSCADPYGGLPACGGWSVGFRLTLAEQVVGATGTLEDHRGSFVETGDGGDPCSFGGGTLPGSFEITAIDDTHVAGRLTGLELFSGPPTIEFDAPRCPS